MQSTKIIATVVTAAALAGTPAAAAAASHCSSASDSCRIALNHNEVLDRT
jgi:hypothetical protein